VLDAALAVCPGAPAGNLFFKSRSLLMVLNAAELAGVFTIRSLRKKP
jgi:hypothetical protein